MLSRLFGAPTEGAAAEGLYAAIVTQARQPLFYARWQVPDTVDGRFEMIGLHAFLVLRRLKGVPSPGPRVSQALFDTMFADMDRSLREMGVGDLGVGRRVKAMAQGFYGRVAAYDSALAPPARQEALFEPLRRNVYGTVAPPAEVSQASLESLARYIWACGNVMAAISDRQLLGGEVRFPDVAMLRD
jgi:cytochrome b pre-mRNA-processing protein 3